MSATPNSIGVSADTGPTTPTELSDDELPVRISIDLVAAARRHIAFLRAVAESEWLHQESTLLESIRRYDELWMPLISDLTVGSTPPVILPPVDVQWVWYCHTLNPVSYRRYCESRFSKIIGKPAIFDEENEEYAVMRCRGIWVQRYPTEPFENELDSDSQYPDARNEDLLIEVKKQRLLYSKFSEPYMSELVYLIAARERYKGFLCILQRFGDGCPRLVLAADISLLWLTHQSYPTVYAGDMEIEDINRKVVGVWEKVKEEELEATRKLWESIYNQPYEKAGGQVAMDLGEVVSVKPPVYWEVSDCDVNTKYKSMMPRFLLEVCVHVRLNPMKVMQEDMKKKFLRLRVVRCHRELKMDKPFSSFSSDSWEKTWHLYCEFGTKGVVLDLRLCGGRCLKGSSSKDMVAVLWNDLLRSPSLTLESKVDEQVRVVVSITPPAQAPYLFKCVPDRVTDDSGAMISDVVLRMNSYRPQEGRWLSRTVLDHAGRECFVVRMRVAGGFWRRGGETPSAVKREDRIIEIREGSWSYLAGTIGRLPEKVVGTATPKEPPDHQKSAWCFSTGDELTIHWDLSSSTAGLNFSLQNQTCPDSLVKLLKGRKMQYQAKKFNSQKEKAKQNMNNGQEVDEEDDDDDEGFVTLVRFTEENPTGRATALLNWKLLVVELLPEEDAVLALLLCISILKSVSEMRKEDVGSLLIRRRLKEAKQGTRDWGSVVLHPSCSSDISLPHLQPWHWNAMAVTAASNGTDNFTKQPAFTYSPVEGGDKLYKRGIIA
ncbi:hypothetical protein VitviT2T_020909 [Vitis vinifera]|nr:hypothetical protein VitviT2T_020909 [Vitis vinifera]|eukprot:XP_010659650.1 PREDICTED: glycine-rich domain-containing protein 2 isoform X2 [Vitis vinifera]